MDLYEFELRYLVFKMRLYILLRVIIYYTLSFVFVSSLQRNRIVLASELMKNLLTS